MNERDRPPEEHDPGVCRHDSLQRLGVQRFPVAPYRYYLLTCRACGTTLTTTTIRRCRGRSASTEPEDAEGPACRLAG